MVERNNQTTYFQTTVPTREEKVSHHAIPLYTKEDAVITKTQYISPEDRLCTHEEQQEWLKNVRKTGY
jgi:hypothetical protein